MTIALVLVPLIFGGAAWFGASTAKRLYGGQTPFDDGPPPTDVRAWIVGFAGMAVGIGVALHGDGGARVALLAVMTLALAACTVADLLCGIVPDLFTLVPLASLLMYAGIRGDYAPLLAAIIVALPFAVLAAASDGRGMGWGDVKLAALGGALLGARGAVLAFTIACFVAFLLSRLMRSRARPIAFAPYLAGGIAVVVIAGAI